jgi:hypothetical protein
MPGGDGGAHGGGAGGSPSHGAPWQDESWDLSAGVRLGGAIRDASRSELGVVLSIGVATNKLLAKLVRSLVASSQRAPGHICESGCVGCCLTGTRLELTNMFQA